MWVLAVETQKPVVQVKVETKLATEAGVLNPIKRRIKEILDIGIFTEDVLEVAEVNSILFFRGYHECTQDQFFTGALRDHTLSVPLT